MSVVGGRSVCLWFPVSPLYYLPWNRVIYIAKSRATTYVNYTYLGAIYLLVGWLNDSAYIALEDLCCLKYL